MSFYTRIKLELSKENTIITDITRRYIKFLGFLIKADYKRKTHDNPNPDKLVGKPFPDHKKVKQQIRKINKGIRKLKDIPKGIDRAIQIERINTMYSRNC